jgi:diadenosine tetraphosphate (Ap4A) HIT family hydrolase/5-methylcytosine-specific restriction endonuclease McrA
MNSQPGAFALLRDFIRSRMRMSHIYQPVMLRTLIAQSGRATIRQIAAEFLARDESQLEYYDEITKGMPGKVLARHSLVERDGDAYRLKPDVTSLTEAERTELLQLCDAALSRYLDRRGAATFDHRRASLGYVSGSTRYEVLKRAGGRCELCGVSIDERAIEIDHIIPRKHGGSDDPTNLQALCYRCNANKGARDATDFRQIREGLTHRMQGCIFCELADARVIASNELAYAIRDASPVTPLHTLLIPKRHAATYFDLFEPERRAISIILDQLRTDILAKDRLVAGFNVGMNSGEAAGQTVEHAHVHLIPRRHGDAENPRGGIRGVIPGKADY